jgi:hypothetical protein
MRWLLSVGLLALLALILFPAWACAQGATAEPACLAAWRWWEDALNWLKSIGMDRGRLVQLWLLFVLIGLYIVMRIKPRA